MSVCAQVLLRCDKPAWLDGRGQPGGDETSRAVALRQAADACGAGFDLESAGQRDAALAGESKKAHAATQSTPSGKSGRVPRVAQVGPPIRTPSGMIDRPAAIAASQGQSSCAADAPSEAWRFRLLLLLVCVGAGLLSVALGPDNYWDL